jgi:acetyl esterase/lipase
MKRPALVQVHGGGWVIGFKDRQGQLLMKRLAAEGWVCFNVDYRLSPMATFPDHLVDVKRAIAWVREHAEEWGVDPEFVCVTGGSAGGHLTALAALTANDPRYQPGFEEADTSVAAAVPFYGVYDFTNRNGAWPAETVPWFLAPVVMKSDPDEDPEAWAAASPLDQVHADAPPFFIIHGDLDVLAPVEDARDFVERLRAVAKEPVYYLELHGAQHAFETFASVRANAVVEAAARFLDAVHDAHRRGIPHEATPEEVEEAVAEELGEEIADALS